MYENLFSKQEDIEGKNVWILLKPNLRSTVDIISSEDEVYSDGEITFENRERNNLELLEVTVSEDATWVLTVDSYNFIKLTVTERTGKIETHFGEDFNRQVNQLFKKVKREYYQKKQKEIRLYFYNAERDWLSISKNTQNWNGEGLEYMPIIPFHEKVAIDRYFKKPKQDAFILGRVRRTIGIKNEKLLDFIEPVYTIIPDFVKEDGIWGLDEYKAQLEDLEFALEKLLEFSIKKEYSDNNIYVKRIAAYHQKERVNVDLFNDEIKQAFESENVAEIRRLYDVFETPQDCTNVKFGLHLKKSLTCDPSTTIYLYYENGEYGGESAKWVYENRSRCVDAVVRYLGDLKRKYEFSII